VFENRALMKCVGNGDVFGEEIPCKDLELPVIMYTLEGPYLSNKLADQKEVIPVPSGDGVVHYGARGGIIDASVTSC
jgi:hypothetical protein